MIVLDLNQNCFFLIFLCVRKFVIAMQHWIGLVLVCILSEHFYCVGVGLEPRRVNPNRWWHQLAITKAILVSMVRDENWRNWETIFFKLCMPIQMYWLVVACSWFIKVTWQGDCKSWTLNWITILILVCFSWILK